MNFRQPGRPPYLLLPIADFKSPHNADGAARCCPMCTEPTLAYIEPVGDAVLSGDEKREQQRVIEVDEHCNQPGTI